MGLFLGQGFIEVQHRAGGDRPGGQFHRVQAGGGGVFAGADPLGRQFGLVRVSGSVAAGDPRAGSGFRQGGGVVRGFLGRSVPAVRSRGTRSPRLAEPRRGPLLHTRCRSA